MTAKEKAISEEIIFKPEYPGRIKMTIYLYPIGILAFLFFLYLALLTGTFFPYGIYALIFGITTLSMPMVLFREVRFGEVIIVKRYFLFPRIIRYEDILDLTPRGLVAKRGGIPLVNVTNRAEFEKIIKRLAAQHKIRLSK
jgi:hypothetical protein